MRRGLAIALLLLVAGCVGACPAPENDGPEVGYVADVEHDPATGQPLAGWQLELARFGEMFANPPFCREPGSVK